MGHSEETKQKIRESTRLLAEEARQRSLAYWTAEKRQEQSLRLKGQRRTFHDAESVSKMSASHVGRKGKEAAKGRSVLRDGHVLLTGQLDHPLSKRGAVLEHRYVLYKEVGPGDHECYWCGTTLSWGGQRGIQADHLNGIKDDNRVENIVVSCVRCNVGRARAGNPLSWQPRRVN